MRPPDHQGADLRADLQPHRQPGSVRRRAAPENWRSCGPRTVIAAATTRHGCAPIATTTRLDIARTTRSRCGTRRRPVCHPRSTVRRCWPTTMPCWSGCAALRSFGLTRLRDVPVDLDEVAGWPAAWASCGRRTSVCCGTSVPSPTRSPTPTPRFVAPTCRPGDAEYQRACSSCTASRTPRPADGAPTSTGSASAEILRDEQPEHFEVLTTVPWRWANRSKVSDYRWASTPIVVDPHGVVTEVRVGNWLRARSTPSSTASKLRTPRTGAVRRDAARRPHRPCVVGAWRPARLRQPAHPPWARCLRRGLWACASSAAATASVRNCCRPSASSSASAGSASARKLHASPFRHDGRHDRQAMGCQA